MLEGKTALVTGGSRGIGRAIVQRLAREGASVVFGYLNNRAAADEVREAVRDQGGHCVAVQADLGTVEGVERLLGEVSELDILVNNAASSITPALLADLTLEEFDRVLAVNTRAVFLAMRHAARHMRDGGRIINISTLNTAAPCPGITAYGASKGAVEQLTAVAAMELGSRGITVNTVSPGATDTDLLRSTNSEEGLAKAAEATPLGRLGRPEDIAAVVAFLAGPDAAWVTGQNILASGGLRF